MKKFHKDQWHGTLLLNNMFELCKVVHISIKLNPTLSLGSVEYSTSDKFLILVEKQIHRVYY